MTARRLVLESLSERVCPAAFGNVWPRSQLTLSFVPDGTDVNGVPSRLGSLFAGVPAAMWQREITRAAQTWANAANLDFATVPDSGLPVGTAGGPQHDKRFGDIRIAAIPLTDVLALGHPFDLAAGTRSGDMWLNVNAAFSVVAAGGSDLYSVALHEIGHALGLPGSADTASAMYQQIPSVPRTGLTSADIALVRERYGARTSDAFEGPAGNETFATAPELDRGGDGVPSDWVIARADLTTAADRDVYRIRPHNLDGGGLVVEVKTTGHSLLNAKLELFDPSGQLLMTAAGPGDLSLTLAGADEGHNYFVRVSPADPIYSVGGYELWAYPELTDDDEPDDDDLEDSEEGDDDTIATAGSPAQNFPNGGRRVDYTFEASLSTALDRDVYRLRAPRAAGGGPVSSLTVVVWAADPTKLDPVLSVADELRTPIPFAILAREGGAFTIQVASALSDQSFYVTVSHAPFGPSLPSGNYFLAAKFGDVVAPLSEYASGSLTAASPVTIRPLVVPQSQTVHLLLTAGAGPSTTGVRLSVLDANDVTLLTRFAYAGETVSTDPFLRPGTYRLVVATGSLNGSAFGTTSYRVAGYPISDPVGPRAVDPNAPPPTSPTPPPPPVAVGPGTPQTPVVPVTPTGPNWFVEPPAQWPAPPASALRPTAPPATVTKTFSVGTNTGVVSYLPSGVERGRIDPFPGFTGGLRVAEADLTGDGVADLVAGTGPGRATAVRIYDGSTFALVHEFAPFEAGFTGGVFVSLGDVTGDGRADLAVSPDEGGGPRVRLFSGNGFGQLFDFYGIDDPNFRGGARTTIGDMDGDGISDLIVAAGFGGGPRVAGYAGPSLVANAPRKLFSDFFVFEQSLRNGIFVAAGDVNGDGYADLIAGGGPGGGPRVYGLDGAKLVNSGGILHAPVLNFFAGDPATRGGVRVSLKHIDGDATADIVTGSGVNAGRRVTAYVNAATTSLGSPPPTALNFDVAGQELGGVFVG